MEWRWWFVVWRGMPMDAVESLLSLFCCGNELRSFVVNGQVLPFCQRCTGVYIGLGITFFYLFATGYYRRGAPRGMVLLANLACIGVMVVFGYHILDPGARWRLWSGLLFGNAVAWLVFPSTCQLWAGPGNISKSAGRGFWPLFIFLNIVPLWFPLAWAGARVAVDVCALAGLVGAAACAASVLLLGLRKGFMLCFCIERVGQ